MNSIPDPATPLVTGRISTTLQDGSGRHSLLVALEATSYGYATLATPKGDTRTIGITLDAQGAIVVSALGRALDQPLSITLPPDHTASAQRRPAGAAEPRPSPHHSPDDPAA